MLLGMVLAQPSTRQPTPHFCALAVITAFAFVRRRRGERVALPGELEIFISGGMPGGVVLHQCINDRGGLTLCNSSGHSCLTSSNNSSGPSTMSAFVMNS